jgi:hypothetical protein
MKKLTTIIFVLFSQIVLGQNPKEKVLVTDMTKIKQIGNISIAPDGKRAIYAVNETVQN